MPSNCHVFITADGSPTLQWTNTHGVSEKMHHAGGALSESFFIYFESLKMVIERGWQVNVMSLGLGLGYNELIAAGAALKYGIKDWRLWSFETQEFLRHGFARWLAGESPSELYDHILKGVSDRLELPMAELKAYAHSSKAIKLRGAYPEDSENCGPCTCVFYDAYSKKMDPELWDETQMRATLEKLIAPRCVLTTYAATGALNRVLKSLGFRLMAKPGFSGKRESTLAIRE